MSSNNNMAGGLSKSFLWLLAAIITGALVYGGADAPMKGFLFYVLVFLFIILVAVLSYAHFKRAVRKKKSKK